MEEKQTLEQAKEQLRNSASEMWSDVKDYGKAVVNHAAEVYEQRMDDMRVQREFNREERQREAEIRERTQDHKAGMQEAFREQDRLAREAQRLQREEERQREAEIRERTQDHKAGMQEAFREQKKQERAARRLQFKENVKQKASSIKAKLGKLKNDLLAKLNLSNLGVKMRNTWDNVQIATLEGLQKGKEFAQNVGGKVSDFATTHIANYYMYQEQRQQFKEAERLQREEERQREAEIRERTQDHKAGMQEAFREQEKQERAARRLQFKENVKQKASSIKAKLGKLKNDLLAKLNLSNLGVKMRNTWDNVQIATLEGLQKGKEFAQNVVGKVSDFVTTQKANYYMRQEEKEQERQHKEFEEAARKAEKEAIDLAKAQLKERKTAMAAALNAQEREMYNQQHLENEQRKQELMAKLFGEKINEAEHERVARTM